MRYLFDLRKIIQSSESEEEYNTERLEKFIKVSILFVEVVLFVVSNEFTINSWMPPHRKFFNWANMTYDKCNKIKNGKIIPFLLKQKYHLSPGALVVTRQKTEFQEMVDDKQVIHKLEPGIHMLYLGSAMDKKYDTFVMKLLENKKVLHYHKRKNLDWFIIDFGKTFSVVRQAGGLEKKEKLKCRIGK